MEANMELKARIKSAKRAVRDATAMAIKFSETSQTVLSNDDLITSCTAATDDDKEFDLAMTLFGDDTRAMEESIQSKLVQVETELRFCLEKRDDNPNDLNSADRGIQPEAPLKVDYESFELDENADSSDKRFVLEHEAILIQSKITFLKKCSEARLELDEVVKLGLDCSTGSKKCVLFPSALKLAEAKSKLHDALGFLHSMQNHLGEEEDFVMKDRDLKIARNILNSIRNQLRYKESDLHSMALSILDANVQMHPMHISIVEGPANADTFEERSYEGIDTALQVLALLSEGDDISKLNLAIRGIAHRFLEQVIRPQVERVKNALDKGRVPNLIELHHTTSNSSSSNFLTKTASTSLFSHKVKGIVQTMEWKYIGDIDSPLSFQNSDYQWWQNLLKFIQTTSEFLHDKVLKKHADTVPTFGNLVFGQAFASKNPYCAFEGNVDIGIHSPILKVIGRIFWDHCIPSSIEKNNQMKDNVRLILQESIRTFESFIVNIGFVSKPTILIEYQDRYVEKCNDKIRLSILSKGRTILRDHDYHNTIEVGYDIHKKRKDNRPVYLDELSIEDNDVGVFFMDKSCISKVASDLMDLVNQTMDQAVDPSISHQALLSPSLYRAARELLDLFRVIIPVAHGNEISSVPRTAAVFHNDCVYFTNRLLTLGFEYRDRFPDDGNGNESPLKIICTFLDLVPIFRELAEKTMNEIIEFQKIRLSELIVPRIKYMKDALGSNEAVMEWTDVETSLTSGIYHCRHLSKSWKSVLSYDVYGRTMGSIVDFLFQLYLDQVIRSKDISESACHFLSSLFRDALKGISEFFGDSKNLEEAIKESSRYCSLQQKITAVGRFMDMNLTDVTMGLTDGAFRSISSAELSALVCATYSDSQKRRDLLTLLRIESNES